MSAEPIGMLLIMKSLPPSHSWRTAAFWGNVRKSSYWELFINEDIQSTLLVLQPGGRLYIKCRLTSIGITMSKIRQSHDCLIFNMVIHIPEKDSLYIETGPWNIPAIQGHYYDWWCSGPYPIQFDIAMTIEKAQYFFNSYLIPFIGLLHLAPSLTPTLVIWTQTFQLLFPFEINVLTVIDHN